MLRLLPFLEDGNLNLYTADVFQFGESNTVQRQLGSTDLNGAETFDWICLNPPFVRQEHVDTALEPYARKATINANLNKRSDLSAYVIMQALHILKEGGRLGFIVPNSIINTAWGDSFVKSTPFCVPPTKSGLPSKMKTRM
jgi:tRNA1(Val) A37 N6-methylase TrmN6